MYEFDVLRMSVLDEESPAAVETLRTIVLDAPITDVPRGPALTLSPEATVATAIEAMRRRARPAIVVVKHQRPIGIVTERDVAAHGGGDIDERSLLAVMTSCPRPLRASESVGAAFRTMCALRQWHLPLVCADGLLVGALDITDLCLWLRDRMTLVSLEAALGA